MKSGKSPRRKPDTAIPRAPEALVRLALRAGDPHSAAAVHPLADGEERRQLEAVMFGERRTALMLARWEHTPASVLQVLSGLGDFAVRVRLDKNPGASSLLLAKLYRGERNAALIGLIAQHRHTPEEVLEQIAELDEDPAILQAACANPAASERVLRTLAARMPGRFDSEIATHPATPADMQQALYATGNVYLRAAIVARADCPQQLLEQAAREQDATILRHLAGNARTAPAMLERLAGNADPTVRRAAAANPALAADVAVRLARDPAAGVRRVVAAREDVPPETLTVLASDPDHWVRQWVARNPATPARRLYQLAREDDPEVRRAVARNPACPPLLLKRLAGDGHAWVRAAVAYQPRATAGLLKALAEDADVDVLSGVASHPRTPQALLQRLAQSAEADVRRGVILNPRATRKTLRPLLEDPYYLHRLLLVGNKALKEQDIWALREDPDPSVRFAALRWFAARLAPPRQVLVTQ